MNMINYRSPATLLKCRRLWRLAIRPIVKDLQHQLYLNEFGNSSLVWDGLQVTLMELVRKTMAIFMVFYSDMVILKNGANTNMIRILTIYAHPLVMLGLYLLRSLLADPFSVAEFLVFNPMTSACASLMRMEISTTMNSIICKPIIPIRHIYTMSISSDNGRDDNNEGNSNNKNDANIPAEK